MLDNVKSKYIIKQIFENIKNKRKLNIIKYNKRIKIKLDINMDDFEIYITLKKFNNKYNIFIEDIDIKELNLSYRNIGNEGLKDLIKINFNKLEVLNLIFNKISDIKVLEKVKFENLKGLILKGNNIDTKYSLLIQNLLLLILLYLIFYYYLNLIFLNF